MQFYKLELVNREQNYNKASLFVAVQLHTVVCLADSSRLKLAGLWCSTHCRHHESNRGKEARQWRTTANACRPTVVCSVLLSSDELPWPVIRSRPGSGMAAMNVGLPPIRSRVHLHVAHPFSDSTAISTSNGLMALRLGMTPGPTRSSSNKPMQKPLAHPLLSLLPVVMIGFWSLLAPLAISRSPNLSRRPSSGSMRRAGSME